MARFEEGRSISCPPLFEGEAYSQWSNVMKYFILAQDFELWDIIEEGYIEAPEKKKKQMSENDKKAKLNARAMHILLCGLNDEVSKKVSTCKRAKEMWEKLERPYGKEEKKDGVPSCACILSSSKVDGALALDEPKPNLHFWCIGYWYARNRIGTLIAVEDRWLLALPVSGIGTLKMNIGTPRLVPVRLPVSVRLIPYRYCLQYRYSISGTDTSKGFRLLEIPETKRRTGTVATVPEQALAYRYAHRRTGNDRTDTRSAKPTVLNGNFVVPIRLRVYQYPMHQKCRISW
ncbi:hypothetical protein V6N11_012234 [Hibiscus sabdariffa]|uniref:DUF4219 domain-containing protein n=1 Tax=Hibiscus sabdariffa TaxID=183260 RepID=A0ABR2QAL5_9ROSI